MTDENAITRIIDIQPLIKLVTDSLTSAHSKRAYEKALVDFLAWWETEGRPPLVKATVNSYKAELERSGLSPATINQRISAIRKLAAEAADNELIPQDVANGIGRVKGVEQAGTRTGNWLTRQQAQALINAPDINTLLGLRDRAILAIMLGAGLRRSEVANLQYKDIQQREGRWVIVDLVGKRNRRRTVPIPSWVKVAIDEWIRAVNALEVDWPSDDDYVFRPLNKGGKLAGDRITSQVVYRVVEEYASRLGFKVAAHDLRRTFAKLAYKGDAKIDQIQLTLGHASIRTTELYLGVDQDLTDAPCDKLGLGLGD
jgi:site-specific recombinase XerD